MSFIDIFRISSFKKTIDQQKAMIEGMNKKLIDIGADRYDQVTQMIESLENERQNLSTEVTNLHGNVMNLRNDIQTAQVKLGDLNNKVDSQTKKLAKIKELYKSIEYAHSTYHDSNGYPLLNQNDSIVLDELVPAVELKLHHMDMKSLNNAFRDNDKLIEKILAQYAARYTTKANQAIYKLMVIALRAELQNVLSELKYGTIDKSIADIKKITSKYLKIASEGNQQISTTIVKFIGEIEYLFINAAKIEYNYYIKKEQIRQEQLAIRQQMREDAEERRQLELEKKRVAQEETKFINEIEKARQQLSTSQDQFEIEKLNQKILNLESKLSDVAIQKEKIAELQHGKAGNVYIISNRGSFGDNIFKIGMTRRIDPQERINELGNASVPFRFDIHSIIFSEDAVNLETELHKRLHPKRVNRVNLRKEFFSCTIDELETIVNELDPTAEFIRTMFANEYEQSLEAGENFDSTIAATGTEDEDEELEPAIQ